MNNRSTPVVDLTANTASSPPSQPIASSNTTDPDSTPGHRRNSSIASISGGDFRSSKRRRHDDNTFSAIPPPSSSSTSGPSSQTGRLGTAIESVDLTEIDETSPLSKTLAKQREDAVKAQEAVPSSEKKGSILTAYKCPVCMDTPVDATSTICGHLFCHKCITDTLRFGEEQRAREIFGATRTRIPRGNCPVCRQALSRRDVSGPKRNLVPLQFQFMKKGAPDSQSKGKKSESTG